MFQALNSYIGLSSGIPGHSIFIPKLVPGHGKSFVQHIENLVPKGFVFQKPEEF
jgi:hypothetical protein